jgi:phosphodiesterase/alkaline phosphatase D-like protein
MGKLIPEKFRAATFHPLDADFSSITGTTTAAATNINQPVKVEVADLDSGTEYFYRVTDAAGASETGRFLTPNELGKYNGLHFGVTGDWRGEIAPYPAIANVADKELDFFVKHGDTIYADDDSPGLLNPDGTAKAQAESIEDYRAKHNEVYSQRFGKNFWADVQASTKFRTLSNIGTRRTPSPYQNLPTAKRSPPASPP